MSKILLAPLFAAGLATAAATKPWVGKWYSSSTKQPEKFAEFLTAIGLPATGFAGPYASGEPILDIQQDRTDFSMSIQVPSKNIDNKHRFTVGVEGIRNESVFNNAEVTFKYTEDGDKLKSEVKVLSLNKVIHDTFEVMGDELVKTFQVDGITAKIYFEKTAP